MPPSTLALLGWDARRATAFTRLGDETLTPARVTRVDRGGCETLTAAGPLRCTFGSGVLTALPCTGDWVVVRRWPDERVTAEFVLERRTLLQRPVVAPGQSGSQPLAANVDVVFLTEGAVPDPDLGRLERLLAVAWESGATPIVLLTKADLAGAAVDVLLADVREAAAGAPVHPVSALTGSGLAVVRAELGPGRTAVLLGASGAGKSTLVNALVGAAVMPTAGLRADGKGRHTTAARELVPLPGGGVLVDTPGLRSIGVNVATATIALVFADIGELATECRFADCAHGVEPGCAVLAALENGDLRERRLASWRKLNREAAHQQAKSKARARAERRRAWELRKRSDREARARARR